MASASSTPHRPDALRILPADDQINIAVPQDSPRTEAVLSPCRAGGDISGAGVASAAPASVSKCASSVPDHDFKSPTDIAGVFRLAGIAVAILLNASDHISRADSSDPAWDVVHDRAKELVAAREYLNIVRYRLGRVA